MENAKELAPKAIKIAEYDDLKTILEFLNSLRNLNSHLDQKEIVKNDRYKDNKRKNY